MATLEQNELELQNTLKEYFPSFSWEAGTAFYEQIVKPWAVNLSDRDAAIDVVKNNMSLVQVLNSDNPDSTLVDRLLSNYNITRNLGTKATGFLAVYFSGTTSVSINPTATFTCAGIPLRTSKTYIGVTGTITEENTSEVEYINATAISDSEYVFSIEVSTVDVTDKVLGPGQDCTYDISSSFIRRIVTSSTFSGGSLPETTAALLERSTLGITQASATGKDNIRSLVQSSPYGVLDSKVFGFGDTVQKRDTHNNAGISVGGSADVYVSTASLLQKADIQLTASRVEGDLWKVDIPSTYAGAYGVEYISDGTSVIDTPLTHEISFLPSNARPVLENAIEARYSKYQQLSVKFYAPGIVEDEKVFTVRVVYMPNIDELQDYIEDPDIQSATSDILVKAFVPIEVSVGVSIEYSPGILPPEVSTLQSAISSAINAKLAGGAKLPSSDVVYAIKQVFPECTVRMPIALQGKSYLPSGQIAYATDNDNIDVPVGIDYVAPGNAKFYSSPDKISVSLEEIA